MHWLKDKRVVITAGPTHEAIDPVRYIGNRSTGKMGYALAQAATERGALVTLVSGPVCLSPPEGVSIVNVVSAQDMYEAVMHHFPACDVLIMAAAVADYTPKEKADHKMKKKEGPLNLTLTRTEDILATAGNRKKDGQITVGFALETKQGLPSAKGKLARKNADLIALNMHKENESGLGSATNRLTILTKHNKITTFELKTKYEAAMDVLNELEAYALAI